MTEQLAITHPLDRLRPFLRKAMIIRDPEVIKRHYPNIPEHLWDVFDKALVKDMDRGETWVTDEEKDYRRKHSSHGRQALVKKTTDRAIKFKRRMIMLMANEAKSAPELFAELSKGKGKEKIASATWVGRALKKMQNDGHIEIDQTKKNKFHAKFYKATKAGIAAHI